MLVWERKGTKMYCVNDTVVYGVQGICKVTDITTQQVEGQWVKYYMLRPIYDDKSVFFVPVQNETLTGRVRPILTKEEIYQLIHSMPSEQEIWIEKENLRKEKYQQILSQGNRKELVMLIKTLYFHQKAQKEKGRKLHLSDERFLREAEKMLYDEFAAVLHIQQDQVLAFIRKELQQEETAQ